MSSMCLQQITISDKKSVSTDHFLLPKSTCVRKLVNKVQLSSLGDLLLPSLANLKAFMLEASSYFAIQTVGIRGFFGVNLKNMKVYFLK